LKEESPDKVAKEITPTKPSFVSSPTNNQTFLGGDVFNNIK